MINFTEQITPEERKELLFENLRIDHLNSEEKQSLLQICQHYSDLFHLPGDYLTSTKTLKHKIPTTTQVPISAKTYRYPKIHEEEVKTQIENMLGQNIIQNSHSPYSSPVWVVPKKADASGKKMEISDRL